MPRSSETTLTKILDIVKKRGGATSADVAAALRIPERTARRHLAKLYDRRDVNREASYAMEAGSPVFHYRYTLNTRRAPRR